jgi:proteasome accessory factor B
MARTAKPARPPGNRAAEGERRLLRVAAWMMDRSEPFTREDLLEAFPDDYGPPGEAAWKKFGRDKVAIERLGVALRLVEDDQTRYLVDRTALHLARLDFDAAEAAVVWMAGRAALRAGDHPLRDELEAALRKLTVGARGLPQAVPATDPIAPPPPAAELAGRLALLAEAVQRRRRLHLVYRGGAAGSETTRDVDVHGYGLRRGEWFFVGRCHLRDEERLFHLSRVVVLQDRPERAAHLCAVPRDTKGGDYRVPPDFDLDDWRLQQPWGYLAHPPLEATVRLRGALARSAARLLPGASLSTGPDGARQAVLQVRNLDGLVRQVLAWGDEAELLAPPEGRARARAILDGLAASLASEVAR